MTDSTGKWRAIQDEFLATGDAAAAEQALTLLRDASMVEAYRASLERIFPRGVAILAVGAYGSGHSFPHSESEIVLLADSKERREELQYRLPEFIRLLWSVGLRPNSVVHTATECLEAVAQAGALALSLFHTRWLGGDRALSEKLAGELAPAFALHRDTLRRRICQLALARHAAHESTPSRSQPDVKDGPGGIADLRTIEWLATLKSEPAPRPDLSGAAAAISSVRCFLHYRAAGNRNVLDFDAQASLAQQKFPFDIREYFRGTRLLFREARHALEQAGKSESGLLESFHEQRSRLSNQDFSVVRDHVLLRNPAQLAGDPSLVLSLLEFIGRHGVPPSPETERRLELSGFGPQPLWSSIQAMLAAPHAAVALRVLQDTGLIRAVLPEWDSLEGVVIPNSEYRYTLDEQALRNVEAVARVEHPQFAALLTEIDDVSLLVFALLFVELGAEAVERARSAAARMEMPVEARETVEFQLRHSSALASASTGRDLDDPATVRQLAERVGTIERLRLLAMLTCARVAASSTPETRSWRLERLWRAYAATRHELHRELETDRIDQVPDSLPANAGFVKGFPQRYLRAHSPAEIASHLELFEQSQPSGVAVKIEPIGGAWHVTIVAGDRPALFASLAGAISSFGLDILKAEAFSNAAGVILDTFVVADPKRMLQLNPTEADRLRDLLHRIALGRTDAYKLMRGRGAPDAKHGEPARVAFDSDACPTATLVEIDAEDRPGLLYSLASVFSSSACNIDIVLVDTKGRRAIDVFYVAHDGQKLPPEMHRSLREKLLAAC